MLNFEGSCTTDTGLYLGSVSLDKPHHPENHLQSHRRPQLDYEKKLLTLKSDHSFPSLTLGLSSPSSSEEEEEEEKYVKFDVSTGEVGGASTVLYRLQPSSLGSAVTSYSGVKKRERDLCGEEDVEMEKVSPKVSDDRDEAGTNTARKKLRLTREQSVVLEDSFKEHTTLNPMRKQDLADQLNLPTRQVEVWFQNRRARTKLKKTEIEYELLKKCYRTLTDENQKLEKELQELKELYKESAPLFRRRTPAATTLTMCPSCCEKAGGDGGCVGVGGGGDENSSTIPFSNIGVKPQFYNPYPFTHPSAAC